MMNSSRQYDDVKGGFKNLTTTMAYPKFQTLYETMLSYCLKWRKKQKVITQGLQKQIKEY